MAQFANWSFACSFRQCLNSAEILVFLASQRAALSLAQYAYLEYLRRLVAVETSARRAQDRGPDVFPYHSEIVGEGYRMLNDGHRIAFEIVAGPESPRLKM
jgi:hypothetical protein